MKNRFVLAALVYTVMAGGIICGFVAAFILKSYFHPWIFGCIFAPLGLLIGKYAGNKFELLIRKSDAPRIRSNKAGSYVTVSFAGFGLLFGVYLNQWISTSAPKTCFVVNKYESTGRRGTHYYTLKLRFEDREEQVDCDNERWTRIAPGDSITMIYYESPIGFDNIQYPEEN